MGMSDGGPRLGFLGAGRMATALARAWTLARRFAADRVLASDPLAAARDAFARETGCPVTTDNRGVAEHADLLVLAVKPQSMQALLAEVMGDEGADAETIAALEELLGRRRGTAPGSRARTADELSVLIDRANRHAEADVQRINSLKEVLDLV